MISLKVALIISTYNWPEALELVLISLKKQTLPPNEIIIADDGSDHRTKDLINKYKNILSTQIHHEWHEDKGFMKSTILNKAISKSKSEYLIQIDGDCFLHPNFIEDHVNNIEKDLYLFGTRVRVKKELAAKLNKNVSIGFFRKGLKKRMRNIRIPFATRLYSKTHSISPKFRGCNMSYWKKDFLLINGYDEDISGWGREDSEFAIRLHNNNINGKRLKFSGIVYHLDHKEESKNNFLINDKRQRNTIKNKLLRCLNGVDKYV